MSISEFVRDNPIITKSKSEQEVKQLMLVNKTSETTRKSLEEDQASNVAKMHALLRGVL